MVILKSVFRFGDHYITQQNFALKRLYGLQPSYYFHVSYISNNCTIQSLDMGVSFRCRYDIVDGVRVMTTYQRG